MAALNEEMILIENRTRVKSDGLPAQTPMRQRRKLGDSSNLFNNGATPQGSKNLSFKHSALASERGFTATALPRSVTQVQQSEPVNHLLIFEKEQEIHLRQDDQLSEFLESKYSVDLEKPEPIIEEEEMADCKNDSLNISLEPNIDVSFLAGSPTIDDVFDLSITDQMENSGADFAHEPEFFSRTDSSFENWLNGQYDVDLGKGDVQIEPEPSLERDRLSSFDKSFELYVNSMNNQLCSIDEVPIKQDEELGGLIAMSDLEQRLLSVDIDELLNL